ncbi:hypothetical protein [Kibdelosporangium phytohabitans]|uniref:Uncharacterized protein n=1 Tax=Kibdelosporangium phytohabitans TaxID=860235 RepID=A0A0N9IC12_9PSEU|nr:hypothetical protein [Kibdelosporangium phytohabitans]ALG13934.1 hypothetical protein AOZ06_49985 [Kibdelosporangium phytohabitans]MBE1467128.1 putative membrane-bound mannosyltransferase [Kibdelosporangium phytohabitans]
MFAVWMQIVVFVLLPLGLAAGYAAGRVSRRNRRESAHTNDFITHPGLAPEYPSYPAVRLKTSYPGSISWRRPARHHG